MRRYLSISAISAIIATGLAAAAVAGAGSPASTARCDSPASCTVTDPACCPPDCTPCPGCCDTEAAVTAVR